MSPIQFNKTDKLIFKSYRNYKFDHTWVFYNERDVIYFIKLKRNIRITMIIDSTHMLQLLYIDDPDISDRVDLIQNNENCPYKKIIDYVAII